MRRARTAADSPLGAGGRPPQDPGTSTYQARTSPSPRPPACRPNRRPLKRFAARSVPQIRMAALWKRNEECRLWPRPTSRWQRRRQEPDRVPWLPCHCGAMPIVIVPVQAIADVADCNLLDLSMKSRLALEDGPLEQRCWVAEETCPDNAAPGLSCVPVVLPSN